MKTPRLALFAFLALALAPAARAATYPQWPIIEEGSRSWPEVRFSVAGKPRALHCRYNECNPKAPKGLINLYLLTKKGPGVPTVVTIYKGVERGKWNPRRYTDGEYDYVPEKIAAMAYPYTAEMSNFKLDTTGAALAVVQGKERIPATTDIDERQFNSYDQMKVAPAQKMLDDELKPAAPPAQRSTWWCDQNSGDIIGVPAGQKPPAGYTRLDSRSSTCGKKPAGPSRPGRTLSKLPTAGKWKDAITPVGEWRAIKTSVYPVLGVPLPVPTMTFYCYHEKMDGDKDLATHLKKHPLIVECVNWSAPADDATKEEGGKKFKVRNNHVQFDLGFTNGKLQTLSGVKGVRVTEIPALPDALGGEKFVKVTAPQAAPAAGASIALLEEENRWLTKVQAADYAAARAAAAAPAARNPVDGQFRALIAAPSRPAARAADKAARAAAAAEVVAKTKEAAGKPEMWGGKDAKDVTAIIAHFQKTASPDTAKMLEIQLANADWELLAKKPDEQLKYVSARARVNGMNGGVENPTFDAKLVDPIALRLSAVAARKAVGSPEPGSVTTPVTGKPDEAALLDLLTDKEKEFLTPSERENYERIYDSAPEPKQKDKSVQNELKKLRPRIKEREGKPYLKEPITEKNFDQAADWQKDQFCNPKKIGGAIAASGPKTNETVLNKPGDVVENLTEVQRKAQADLAAQQAAAGVNPLPAWAVEKCKGKPFFKEPAPSRPTDTNLAINQPVGGGAPEVKKVTGVDAEAKEKEKSKWLTQDLLTSAAKGAMVGLLVGSLFGPVGLIAGPLLGGALFYGLTKITS